MSIAQRKDGRWIVKYKDPVTGKWQQKAFRDEVQASEFNEEVTYDKPENHRLTLRECVTLFIQNVPHCKKVVDCYDFLVNGHDRKKDGVHTEGPAEFLATKYCDTLDRRDLENLRQALRERGQTITSINLNVNRIRAAMNWAADQDMLVSNPWAKYKSLAGGKTKHRRGSLENFIKVYALLPGWLQWACRTCIALCLRPGTSELGSLEWSAFDWSTRVVRVYMPKVDRTKTVCPPDLYWEEALKRFQEASVKGQVYVCPNRSGHMLQAQNLWEAWRAACNKAGVRLAPYAMRHIAASQMNYAGADIAAIAAQLGHKDPTITLSVYTDLVAGSQRRAAAGLPLHHLVQLVQNQGNEKQ